MIITGKDLKKNLRFSRRHFLKSAGASLAYLPLIHTNDLFAQSNSGFPKRMVNVTMCNGNNVTDFHNFHRGSSETLSPLMPWKDKVTTIKGLGLKVMVDAGRPYGGHHSNPSQLSGSFRKGSGNAGSAKNASVDQVVSDHIAKSVNLTRPLLNLGVRSERDGRTTSWRGNNQPNQNEVSSESLFKSLFGSEAVPAQGIAVINHRKASVLDFLGKDLEAFSRRLGSEDRVKIENHLSSIRELEKQLQAEAENSMNMDSCAPPEVDLQGGTPGKYASGAKVSAAVPARMDAMFKMLSVALKCDITRVATFEMYDNGGGNGNTFPWIGVNRDYHQLAHGGQSAAKNTVDKWLFSQVAILLAELDGAQEGGVSALDNSVVSVGNDMETGNSHRTGRINFVLIGSAGGALNTGQRLDLGSGKPHNSLLTTLANGMGVQTNQIGSYSGNISQLLR